MSRRHRFGTDNTAQDLFLLKKKKTPKFTFKVDCIEGSWIASIKLTWEWCLNKLYIYQLIIKDLYDFYPFFQGTRIKGTQCFLNMQSLRKLLFRPQWRQLLHHPCCIGEFTCLVTIFTLASPVFSQESTDKEHQICFSVLNWSSPSACILTQKLDRAAFHIYLFLLSVITSPFTFSVPGFMYVKPGEYSTF
jgi:hypothetical protein